MASVDPYQLLKALSVLLNRDGSIRGEPELTKVLNLMKAARKLVSRCIYINILRATTDKAVLQKFVSSGGWEILNIWLQEAKENENNPFILELIKLFKQIPVTVDVLKKTNTAKTIKQFSKGDSDDRLKACSSELVETWMTVIRGSGPTIDKASVAKKKKLKKPPSEKEDSPKGKKELKEEIETETKDTNHKRTSESKEGSNKKLKTEESDKKSDVTDRTSPPKEVKKPVVKKEPKKENSKPKQSDSKGDDKKEEDKKKEEKSDEKEKKTKTKTRSGPAFAKMRSTGLESNAKLPPVNKKKKTDKPVVKPDLKSATSSIKRDGPLLSKSLTPPEKKVKTEEKPAVERRTSTGIRVKIIQPKPKLQESSGFLEALNAPVTPVRKKVKKPNKSPLNKDQTSNKGGQDGSKGDKSPATPEDSKPEPPKFNFYSNAEPEEGKDDNQVFGEVLAPDEDSKKEDMEGSDKKAQGSKSNLKIVPSRKKKSVTWKEDSELVDICYFDLDENERENVNRPKDFRNAAQMEMRNERETILNAMKGNLGMDAGEEDSNGAKGVIEEVPWRRPPKLDIVPLVVYGCNSTEKDTQAKRERTVLQEIFFSAAMIPDTPKEPDLEAVEYEEPKRIPLEDETSPDPIEPLAGGPTPGYMPGQQPLGGLPPEIASLVNQIPKQQMVGGSGQSGEPSMDKIKEILSTVMSNPSQSGIPQDVDIHSESFTNKLREIIAPFKSTPQETSNPPPLLQAPPQHPPPLLETGIPPPGSQPPPMYGYGPEHMDQYPDPMGQYSDYGDYPGAPPPEMGLPEEPYPPYEGRNPGYPPLFPEEGYQGPRGPGVRFRGPRPMGPRFRGSWGRGRGGNIQKVCYHFTSHRGCRLGNSCHFVHPGVTRPPPRR